MHRYNFVPEELRFGHKLSYDRLKTFGCEADAHVLKDLHAKLDPKARRCIFIGYGLDGLFGYCLWDLESQLVIDSTDVVFDETKMHRKLVKEIEFQKVTFFNV